MDVVGGRALPAAEMVRVFLAAVRPGLEAGGDLEEVTELVEATVARGTGAARQRQELRRTGRLEEVVDMVVDRDGPLRWPRAFSRCPGEPGGPG